MNLHCHSHPDPASAAAAELLASWLNDPTTRTLMVAAGNTPIDLYNRIARRHLALPHLEVFALDEYLGVPPREARNCGCLLRRAVAQAWGIPETRFHALTTLEAEADAGIAAHEARILAAGGLDIVVLGLGRNGHLGFNEPGSTADGDGRVVPLDPVSVEANQRWFGGDYAPARGVTVGLRTILRARRVLLLAFGPHKAAAVQAMVEGPVGAACPASFLQDHPHVHVFLDETAAANLRPSRRP